MSVVHLKWMASFADMTQSCYMFCGHIYSFLISCIAFIAGKLHPRSAEYAGWKCCRCFLIFKVKVTERRKENNENAVNINMLKHRI